MFRDLHQRVAQGFMYRRSLRGRKKYCHRNIYQTKSPFTVIAPSLNIFTLRNGVTRHVITGARIEKLKERTRGFRGAYLNLNLEGFIPYTTFTL